MGCDGDGDKKENNNNNNNNNNNSMIPRSEVEDDDEVPYRGILTRIVSSNDRIHISRRQMKANRRMLKKLNLLARMPRMTKDSPIYGHTMVPTIGGGHAMCLTINGHALLAAKKRREAGSKPVVNQLMNPEAGSSQATATGTIAKGVQGSLLKHPREDLDESTESLLNNPIPAAYLFLEIDTQAEVKGGSVLKRPAADPSATVGTEDEVEGGAVLKRACVNLGESRELVAGNLNPADPSAAAGTAANVKGGSVLNKDLESSG